MYILGELIGIENIGFDVIKFDVLFFVACVGGKNETFVNVSEIKFYVFGIRVIVGVDEYVLVFEVNESYSKRECYFKVIKIWIKEIGIFMMFCS